MMRAIAGLLRSLSGEAKQGPTLPSFLTFLLALVQVVFCAGISAAANPSITSLTPTSAAVGVSVTIKGTSFGSSQGTSTVTFNGTPATPTTWANASIKVPVPAGATTGNVVVTVSGVASNGVSFTVLPTPSITSLTPSSDPVGAVVTIAGTNFGTTQGTSTVVFNKTTATPTAWSNTSIQVPVPTGASTGNVVVTVSGVASNGVSFTVLPTPSITSLTPTSSAVGVSVTVKGTNFGSSQGTSTVTFNGMAATPTTWANTSIKVPVPTGATTGNVVVTVNGVVSNGVSFTVLPTPGITSLTPSSGPVGAVVTIAGTNFGATQGTSTVVFNKTTATPTAWSNTSIQVPVPTGATTGNVVVTVSGVASSGVSFTVLPTPSITSLTPTSGAVGVSVTIKGTSFGSSQGTSTVSFNGTPGTPTTWANTSIKVPVPSGATTGYVVVTVNGVPSNGVSFIVPGTTATISTLSPTSGPAGSQVSINGSYFGSSQGSSTVSFNGTLATNVVSWTSTLIVATVPSAATSGNLVVKVGGVASNGVSFTVLPTPSITSLSLTSGAVGTSVTITGTNFGSTQGSSTVTFNGTTATPSGWNATSIVAPVPSGATTGPVVVTVSGVPSAGVSFAVLPTPSITSLSPTSGGVGTLVMIAGTNFGSTQGSSTVTFNGTIATPSGWNATLILAPVPSGATTGNVVVTVNAVPSNGQNFTVTATVLMNTSRYQHSATLLNTGKVLLAGGVTCPAANSCTYLSNAELYDPASGHSTNTGSLATARSAPAVLLANGKVLVAGGATCDSSGNCSSLSSAEIYDPASGTFASAGNMNVARDGHTMTVLSDGSVLIAGGETCSVSFGNESRNRPATKPLYDGAHLVYASFTPITGSVSCTAQATAEIYDPVSGSFAYTSGSLNVARYNAAAAQLVDGRVLIVGGSNEFNPLSSAELYNPSESSFTQTASNLGTARSSPAATLLNNGLVLITGGSTCETPTCPTNTAELYNATTNAFQSTSGGMTVPRVAHTATLLTNGQVLLAGGKSSCIQANSCTSEPSTESYDPTSSTFSVMQAMVAARSGHSGTVLSNGSVLLAGGIASGTTVSSIEFYQPASFTPTGLVSIAVTPANSSTGIGEVKQFTATGTFSGGSTSTLQSVVWGSSNSAVASVNNAAGSSGFAFGLGLGSTTITATAGTISGSSTLTVQLPNISSISPGSGAYGTQLTISGTNLGPAQESGNVTIAGVVAPIVSWTDTSIVASLPSLASPGVAQVIVNSGAGTSSNSASFTVFPSIAGFSPSAGPVGTTITVNGANFGSSGVVTFDGISAQIVSWSPTSISVVVPAGSSSGNVIVTSNSESSNTAVFTVLPTPNISGLSSTSGAVGAVVTITGTNFGATQGTSTLAFNGTVATPSSWSAGSIVVQVPADATTGNIVIAVGGIASNGVNFTVVPTMTSLSPTSGTVGTLVAIVGTGFGSSQGASTVTFNGTAVTPISWSSSSITAPVPPGATTGNVVVKVNGVSSNGISFAVQAGGFVATNGSMEVSRYGQTATQLTTGQVLIAGGMSTSAVANTAELYTSASQTFAAAGAMNVARWLHTATLLNDGTVLVAGGSDLSNQETLDSAEIYNPATGTFTLLSNTLNTARVGHTATLLNNGQVLLVGGHDPETGLIADAEIYDPPTQTFIDLGDTNAPRYGHTATMLQNGQVLIAGGETDPTPSAAYNTAEIFDPPSQTFIPVPVPMAATREGHAAVLLNNGQVLITGGDIPGTGSLNTAEIYDPISNTFTAATSTMTAPRISHAMKVLNGGKVLIAGGATDSSGGSTALSTAELYDPASQTFVPVGNMTSARERQTSSLLNDGTVFVTGGTDGTNVYSTAEIYTSSRLTGLGSIAITPDAPSIGSGAQQRFTAIGTFSDGSTQTLSSVLWSSSSAATAPIGNDATNSGVASAAATGTTTVTASAAGISGSATLTVTTPILASINLSPQDPTIPLGATQQFTATGVYTDGSTQDLTGTATWSTSATVVAAINSSGLAAGLFQGTATIQANSGSVSASTTVSVASPALVSIAVTPATAAIALGTSQQFQATGTYSDGSTQNATTLVAWSSAASTVATANGTGLALGVGQGTTTLTATFESIAVTVPVTVGPPNLTSLSITPSAANLSIGATQQLNATGTYTDGSTQNLTASSMWASSNTNIIGVSSSGLASAVAIGSATITVTSGSINGTSILIATAGTTTASLNTSRYQQSATNLNNGQILVAGGINCPSGAFCTYLNSAELYNPSSDAFTNTGAMSTPRSAPSVLLNSGKVFTAGGYTCDSSGNCSSLSSAEIYDPAAGVFSSAGSMTVARSEHTMSLLSNGTVLIAGGQNCTSATSCSALSSAEIYDPVAGTFTATSSSMSAARFGASAVLLSSGYVLIAGGFDGTNLPAATELYAPTGFIQGPSLIVPRFDATATLLNNGNVLIAGGSTCNLPGCPTSDAELFILNGNQIGLLASGMNVPRFNHTATLATNGTVVITGGYSSCGSTCTGEASTEVFDPIAGAFSPSQPVTTALAGHTATLGGNGDILLIGGINAGMTLAADQWYQPASLTPANLVSIAVSPANSFLALGETQPFVATGTFNDGSTQTLQSVIWSSSNLSVATISNSPGSLGIVNAQTTGATTLTANAGNIVGSTSVNVAAVVSLAVTPANPTLIDGEAQQFTATATLSDGSTQNVTTSATWTTSNNVVAYLGTSTSGPPGYATCFAAGTATVTATLGSVQASTSVTGLVQGPTPSITTVSPTSGQTGTQVLISGTGFGSTQGNGSVLVGSTPGTVLSWSDTQIVATVIPTSTSGAVQVLQNDGYSSNAVPFTVNTATISTVSPSSGVSGTQVTLTGSGFGATQGSGSVWLGSTPGTVVSWSNTQIVATVASISRSGIAQVQQNGFSSNAVPFSVNTAMITAVSPSSGVPGTQVTLTGSGFGASQGSGQVWLGTANGVVQSWSDTQVVALVAIGSTSGNAVILQSGVMTNSVPFAIDSLHISSATPNSGAPGTLVTIAGTGFGSSQGNGTLLLGGTNGQVMSWSDTQVVATVAASAVTGVVRIEQNSVWSNAVSFTVPNSSNPVTLIPNMLNLVVGQTQTIQALNASGQSVTGLTWTSSNLNIVSLSTDDPPILTALAVGHVTISTGNASADVTVNLGPSLALGTVIWSNPGDGSGVMNIVPAVPSASGVADVFALNGDCNAQAITSDGTVAWTANIGQLPPNTGNFNATCSQFQPDFQGGLVVLSETSQPNNSLEPFVYHLQKFDGITGQAYPSFDQSIYWENVNWKNHALAPIGPNFPPFVVHTDGTIFTVLDEGLNTSGLPAGFTPPGVAVINPLTGQSKPITFSGDEFPIAPYTNFAFHGFGNWIVAGDGYAYLPFAYQAFTWPPVCVPSGPNAIGCVTFSGIPPCVGTSWEGIVGTSMAGTEHVGVLRIDTSGNASSIILGGWDVLGNCFFGTYAAPTNLSLITNADQGVLATWQIMTGSQNVSGDSPGATINYIAATSGTSLVSQNTTPNLLTPVLQAQDGTFYGTVTVGGNMNMTKFNQAGNLLWSVPGDSPKIATSDNGVIGASGATYDGNGNATGQVGSMPTYSWKGAYQDGPVTSVADFLSNLSTSFAAVAGGNFTGGGTSLKTHTFGLSWCGGGVGEVSCTFGENLTWDFCPDLPGGCVPDKSFAGDYPDWVAEIKAGATLAFNQAFLHYPIVIQHGSKGAEFTAYVTGDKITSGDQYIGSGQARLYYYGDMIASQDAIGFPCAPNYPCLTYPPTNPTTFGNFLTLVNAIGTGIGNSAAHEASHYLANQKNQSGYGLPIVDCGLGNRQAGAVACYNNDNFVYEFYSATGEPQDPTNEDSTGGSFFYVNIPGHPIHQELRDDCWIQQWTIPNQKKYVSGGIPCP